jgi:glucose-6-phosphate isomerase
MLPALTYDQSHLTDHDLLTYEHKLEAELSNMKQASLRHYEDERASINLPVDLNHLRMAKAYAKKYSGISLLIIVGIGGSNLGTMAVQEALLGKLHNLKPGKRPKVLYADTVDPSTLAAVNSLMEAELKSGKKVLISLVSKSGGTTESIANFEVLLQTLMHHRKDYKKYVVITTDQDSQLWHFAHEQKFSALPIPKKVGGRYSVFSLVGLFPLAVLGIDIKRLLDGAARMRMKCLKPGHNQNPAIIRASMLAHEWAHGHTIADNFYFKTDFESIGKWYRQLMGESIGKQWNRQHDRQIWTGITPTVSIGSTDLHSMAQLYFGGPNDKFFTLVTVKNSGKLAVPKLDVYDQLVHNIQGKQLSQIMDAIAKGTASTLQNQNRPFCNIELADASEESIGALLQLHMMEMIFLGALFDVNPFDQPNVEAYKIETKKVLAGKHGKA